MMVVVSDDPTFLTIFAERSLKGRLLAWSTRLLVVTRSSRKELVGLLSSHWTFSMTNSMILNVDNLRYGTGQYNIVACIRCNYIYIIHITPWIICVLFYCAKGEDQRIHWEAH